MKAPKLLLALSIAALTAGPAFAADPAAPTDPAATAVPAEAPAPAESAPKNLRKKGRAQRPAQVVRAIDKDGDHKLDHKEIEELTKQFDADPKGPLGRFDMNANGKLERDEIKMINDRMAKQGERKGKGRGQGKKTRGKQRAA